MKLKFIFFLFIVLIASNSFAQLDSLRFKGHLIDGQIDTFINVMLQEGCTYRSTQSNFIILNGSYANQDSCLILISAAPNLDVVGSLFVAFPKATNWEELRSVYFDLKQALIEKYGPCQRSVEDFMGSYMEGDGKEMEAVKADKVFFYSQWQGGAITLTISKTKRIILKYKNTSNVKRGMSLAHKNVMDKM